MSSRPLQIVMPMAGAGQRFADAGYVLPKPLIPIAGLPMVVRAVRDLPAAARVIMLVRTEHIDRFNLDAVVKKHLPHATVVPVGGLTAGQACTVRLAADYLDPEGPVIVAACDNTHLYDRAGLLQRLENSRIDALIWTYRNDPRVQAKPQQYGWVEVDPGSARVRRVSCKVPLSAEPLHDHAVSGFFAFHRAATMIAGIDALIAADQRVNDEFFLDVVPNMLIGRGLNVEVFEVDKYIGWGTPAEYEDFLRWQRYFDALF